MSETYNFENGSSITTIDNVGENRRSIRGERQLANLGIIDEYCDLERVVIDQRNLDDSLIEPYYQYETEKTKVVNPTIFDYISTDTSTAYEIDNFDEYSQDKLSKEHLLDYAQDLLRELSRLNYRDFTMNLSYARFVDEMRYINEIIRLGRE